MAPTPTEQCPRAVIHRIAIVGSGPSGCYTAMELRRRFPESELCVFERTMIPYGLVRYGVAADHQGTKRVTRQFARLFEGEGVRFVGNVQVGTDVSLDDLRACFDIVVLAHGLHADVPLSTPGADLPGIHGAGWITRLLNSHPDEHGSARQLAPSTAIIGHGNVAIDIARLLAKNNADLISSDIDLAAHATLTRRLQTIHLIGRSLPEAAKFDLGMARELLDLPGVRHDFHGLHGISAQRDARSELFAQHLQATGSTRIRIEWWFGYVPEHFRGLEHVERLTLLSKTTNARHDLAIGDVITAVGFGPSAHQHLRARNAAAEETGRLEHGLYVAGWARRGPRGTIPQQRTDAKQLAELIKSEAAADPRKRGYAGLEQLLEAPTDYETWLRIDALEGRDAARPRIKVSDPREIFSIATGSTTQIGGS